MSLRRFLPPRSVVLLVAGLAAAGYLSRGLWLTPEGESVRTISQADEAKSATEKIIVGDQAQKNLGLIAKPLKAETFWKTIAVPGMVVDRPGVSDREVVVPTVGVVTKIWQVPGDLVRAGDKLFMLKLSSESLHQTQTDLFKTSQNIKVAEARLNRLVAAGEGIAQSRVVDARSELKLLEVADKSYRHELLSRGFSADDIDGVADGKLLSEILIAVPAQTSAQRSPDDALASATPIADLSAPTFELQELKVELGEQVQAGETLCVLSNHGLLAIEGRAFRDETLLLERSVKEGWPVEVDFQEVAGGDWPSIEQEFPIRYIANTIDPVTRTFAFLMSLENQSKTVDHGDRKQLLWRFRPGQKVRLRVRVEKLDHVFVLPADAVAREALDSFVFTQNVNTFERKSVHVLFSDRDRAVIANDGSLPTYVKNNERWTIPAVVLGAAAQLNRMTKAGSTGVPKGYHIHADGSLHKNEDEAK